MSSLLKKMFSYALSITFFITKLCHLAPLAMMQCISISFATGEVSAIVKQFKFSVSEVPTVIVVFLSGMFSL